uniref:F-box domain-containing protein n=1 Tax=Panagrolaimus sp. JU765 TaxID=591449 RepID=A0AC34RDY3_9BILA
MPDHFNFLGLPSTVQDLIAEEVVHKTFPEARIQFALTCKSFNELVKRAKPKKMISCLGILEWTKDKIVFSVDNKIFECQTSAKLEEILEKCQIVGYLLMKSVTIFSETNPNWKVLILLSKSAKYVRNLYVKYWSNDYYPNHIANPSSHERFIVFYHELEHLIALTFSGCYEDFVRLPYFPPAVHCHHVPSRYAMFRHLEQTGEISSFRVALKMRTVWENVKDLDLNPA